MRALGSPYQHGSRAEIFKRPVLTASGILNSVTSFASLHAFTTLHDVPLLSNAVNFYTLFRADLCVRFVINGSAFHYGRYVLAWIPFFGGRYASGAHKLCQEKFNDPFYLMQGLHVMIDPSTTSDVVLRIPYVNDNTHTDLTVNTNSLSQLGELRIVELYGVAQVGQSSATNISYSVYQWFENVDLRDPNPNTFVATGTVIDDNPHENSPQVDLSESARQSATRTAIPVPPPVAAIAVDERVRPGPVESVLTVVKNVSRLAKTIPILWPFAIAAEIGSTVGEAVAHFFGWSKPVVSTDMIRVLPTYAGNMAVAVGRDGGQKLTLDPLSQISSAGGDVGFSDQDEMSFGFLLSRFGVCTHSSWASGNGIGASLLVWPVTPMVVRSVSVGNYPLGAVALTPVAMVASMFGAWRGTLIYRITFVTSPMLRGRAQVRWLPTGNPSSTPFSDISVVKCVIDLSVDTVVDVAVGWGQAVPYLSMSSFFTGSSYSSGVSANGWLAIDVVNDLSSPMATNENVSFYVEVKAGDDFDLVNPGGQILNNGTTKYEATGQVDEPQVPSQQIKVCQLGGSTGASTGLNRSIFADPIVSVRALMKRFYPVAYGSMSTLVGMNWVLPNAFPFPSNSTHFDNLTNPGSWVAAAYLGKRGCVRAKVITELISSTTLQSIQPTILYVTADDVCGQPATLAAGTDAPDLTLMNTGTTVSLSTLGSCEFDIPQRLITLFSRIDVDYPLNESGVTVCSLAGAAAPAVGSYSVVYMAAGEDFSYVGFQGAPYAGLLNG